MIKKIWLILSLVHLLFIWFVVAQSVSLWVNTTDIDIYWSFSVTAQINPWNGKELSNISIAWMDQFEVLSKSQRQQTQIINGSMSQQIVIALQLAPKDIWSYTLWPASFVIDGQPFVSNELTLTVWDVSGGDVLHENSYEEESFFSSRLFTRYLTLSALLCILIRMLWEEIKKERNKSTW